MRCATHGSRKFFQGGGGPNGETSDLKIQKAKKRREGAKGGGGGLKLVTFLC